MKLPFANFLGRRHARRVARFAALAARVVAVMSDGADHHVLSVAQASGLSSGDVFVILAGLESRGVVVSGWGDRVYPGGPRRRWYRLADSSARGGAS